jgi:hypothetical protein
MELIFALILTTTLTVAMAFVHDASPVSKIAGRVFAFTTISLVIWLVGSDKQVEVIPTTEIINTQTGASMVGYFSDSTTFKMVPNYITEIKVIHPRWGSLDDVKFEY